MSKVEPYADDDTVVDLRSKSKPGLGVVSTVEPGPQPKSGALNKYKRYPPTDSLPKIYERLLAAAKTNTQQEALPGRERVPSIGSDDEGLPSIGSDESNSEKSYGSVVFDPSTGKRVGGKTRKSKKSTKKSSRKSKKSKTLSNRKQKKFTKKSKKSSKRRNTRKHLNIRR